MVSGADRPNFYAGAGFDRAGHRRKDAAWLAERLADPQSRFVPIWQGRSLIRDAAQGPLPVLIEPAALAPGPAGDGVVALLGVVAERAHFALELAAAEPPLARLGLDPAGPARFEELRAVGPLLGRRDGALLAYARGLLHWHGRHRFCGVCGSPTVPEQAGHLRRCTSSACATGHFPRTDPAVIMLVTDGSRCLLGRQPQWAAGMYSTLAGFVEPGESLEEAVAREVMEEAGIEIGAVGYQSSQPWPFPGSIMLGFRASACSTAIRLADAELEDARWVERGWLRAAPEDASFRLPRRDSIARRLIEDWLAEG